MHGTREGDHVARTAYDQQQAVFARAQLRPLASKTRALTGGRSFDVVASLRRQALRRKLRHGVEVAMLGRYDQRLGVRPTPPPSARVFIELGERRYREGNRRKALASNGSGE